MPRFRAIWSIEVDADSAEEAAQGALAAFRTGSLAGLRWVWTLLRMQGDEVTGVESVDLDDPEPGPLN